MILRNLMLAVAIMTCNYLNANETKEPIKDRTASGIVECYIDAITRGETKHLKYIFNDEFKFRFGVERNRGGKETLVRFLKEHKGCVWNCNSSFEIIEETTNLCIAKVRIEFSNGIRIDYITLHRSDEGWQIYNSVSTL